MNNNYLLSIIIPIYNAEKYIYKCIESILNQTFSNFEIILINDGSTDKSVEICTEFAMKDKRIKVIHSPNKGASNARNIGLNNAKGKWITFVDSDDWLDPTYFSEFIDSTTNADLICGGFIINNNPHSKYTSSIYHKNLTSVQSVEILYNIYFGMIYNIWGKFFLTEYIKLHNIKFKIGYENREDGIFLFDYLYWAKKISIISSQSFYHYRVENTKKGLSQKKWEINNLLSIYDTFYKGMNLLCAKNSTNKTYNKIIQSDMSMTYMNSFNSIICRSEDLPYYLSCLHKRLKHFNIIKKYRGKRSTIFKILFNLRYDKLLIYFLTIKNVISQMQIKVIDEVK